VLDTVPDATVVIDDRGIIQSFNAAAERLFGFGKLQLSGTM
jgi:two-component system sensor kinase FixL